MKLTGILVDFSFRHAALFAVNSVNGFILIAENHFLIYHNLIARFVVRPLTVRAVIVHSATCPHAIWMQRAAFLCTPAQFASRF